MIGEIVFALAFVVFLMFLFIMHEVDRHDKEMRHESDRWDDGAVMPAEQVRK